MKSINLSTLLLDMNPGLELNIPESSRFLLKIEFFHCRRLEQNSIKVIPPGAFSPYKKLRRM